MHHGTYFSNLIRLASHFGLFFWVFFSPSLAGSSTSQPAQEGGDHPRIELFFQAAEADPARVQAAMSSLSDQWDDSYATMIVELVSVLRANRETRDRVPRLLEFLRERTEQDFKGDLQRWRRWIWNRPYDPHPHYHYFKGLLYGAVDPEMKEFFPLGVRSTIRLDQVVWGGVKVNGIPPLDHPKIISAEEADYLNETDLVFGLQFGTLARAYPKKVLGWHELVLDRLGKTEVTLVFCTLCGVAVLYRSSVRDVILKFGTSGLLYQSNKLLFDDETHSLWSTLTGVPVVGALAGSDLELRMLPIVTTTWAEWQKEHPQTTTLSRNTGFERDYSEGSAYREYFSTQELMFSVDHDDTRLPNKAEIVGVRVKDGKGELRPVAIASAFLQKNRVFNFEAAGITLVAVTSPRGSHRIYQTAGLQFEAHSEQALIQDQSGRPWRLEEDSLVLLENPEVRLPRIPTQRAFWFGWRAQYPATRLLR